jgi:hypothetical protein
MIDIQKVTNYTAGSACTIKTPYLYRAPKFCLNKRTHLVNTSQWIQILSTNLPLQYFSACDEVFPLWTINLNFWRLFVFAMVDAYVFAIVTSSFQLAFTFSFPTHHSTHTFTTFTIAFVTGTVLTVFTTFYG